MIDYSPFWRTLKEHNRDISMKTINDLCRILNCNIDDIAVYVPSDQDQIL